MVDRFNFLLNAARAFGDQRDIDFDQDPVNWHVSIWHCQIKKDILVGIQEFQMFFYTKCLEVSLENS